MSNKKPSMCKVVNEAALTPQSRRMFSLYVLITLTSPVSSNTSIFEACAATALSQRHGISPQDEVCSVDYNLLWRLDVQTVAVAPSPILQFSTMNPLQ